MQLVVQAVRSLWRSPGFMMVVVPVLALALASAISTWAIVDSVLLRPLPYGDSARLVRVGHDHSQRGVVFGAFARQDFEEVEAGVRSLVDVSAYLYWPGKTNLNVIVDGVAFEAPTTYVSAHFFDALRVVPTLGRTLTADDSAHGNDVVFVSDAFWRRVLGERPTVLGDSVTIDGRAHTVIGVAPPTFEFPSPEVSFWLPLKAVGAEQLELPIEHKWLDVVANLKRGTSIEEARGELDALFAARAQRFPHANEGFDRAHVEYALDSVVGRDRPWIIAVLVATVLLVAVAYVNLGGMLYARVVEKSKDAAIQSALGAHVVRIAAHTVISAMLIALVASLIGLTLAWVLIHLVLQQGLIDVARAQEVTLPGWLVAASMASAMFVAALSALIPMARILSIQPAAVITGASAPSSFRAAYAMAAVQIAAVLAITYGAMTVVTSAMRLQHVDLGLRTQDILEVSLSLQRQGGDEDVWRAQMTAELVRATEELPQARTVTAAAVSPLAGAGERYGIDIGSGSGSEEWVNPDGGFQFVSHDYFATLNVRLLAGAPFTGREVRAGEPIPMIVNEAFAKKYFRNQDIVGRKLRTGLGEAVQIVAITDDVLHSGPSVSPKPTMYLPLHLFPRPNVTLLIAAHASDAAFADSVRQNLMRIAPMYPITRMQWLDDAVDRLTFNNRLVSIVLSAFSTISVLVVGIGLYSLLSITFAARRRELAVRKALGATDLQVYLMVMRQALLLAGAGMLMGIPFCVATSSYLAAFLYGTGRVDFGSLAAICVFAGTLAALAAAWPAHRVLRSDTSATLRSS